MSLYPRRRRRQCDPDVPIPCVRKSWRLWNLGYRRFYLLIEFGRYINHWREDISKHSAAWIACILTLLGFASLWTRIRDSWFPPSCLTNLWISVLSHRHVGSAIIFPSSIRIRSNRWSWSTLPTPRYPPWILRIQWHFGAQDFGVKN